MGDVKETNPKDAIGSLKVPFHLIPPQVLGELGLALLEGACKYGAFNYRVAGVRWSVYHDALMRHLSAYAEGQDIDPESGLSHITKAIACLVVLRDSQLQGNHTDDRAPASVHSETWVQDLNARAKALIAKYPEPKPANTQRDPAPTPPDCSPWRGK